VTGLRQPGFWDVVWRTALDTINDTICGRANCVRWVCDILISLHHRGKPMHTASMNVTILSALRSAENVERMPTPNLLYVPKFIKSLFGYLVTPRLRKLSFSLADACNKLQIIVFEIQRSSSTDLIDEALEKRESLEKMKRILLDHRSGLRASYRDLDPDGILMPKFHKEVTSVIALMDEFYEIATELQWAIAEHDASNSVHHQGYAASNIHELEVMLKRIAAGT